MTERDRFGPARAKRSLLVEYSLVLAAVGFLFLNIETSGITMNGRIWPLVVLALLGLTGSLLLLSVLLWPASDGPEGTEERGRDDSRGKPVRRYMMMAVYAVFIMLLPSLGFALATAAFVPLAARLLGMPARLTLFALSLCIAVAIYLLFSEVFSIPLPEGRLMHLPSFF